VITEFPGTLRYSAASKTEFRADGVRPSRNRGFRCRTRVGTPLAAPESERRGRVPGTLGLNGVDLVVSEVGDESTDCFFTRALRRSPRFRIVIGKQPAQSNDCGWQTCVRVHGILPCIADEGLGVFPVYDECVATTGARCDSATKITHFGPWRQADSGLTNWLIRSEKGERAFLHLCRQKPIFCEFRMMRNYPDFENDPYRASLARRFSPQDPAIEFFNSNSPYDTPLSNNDTCLIVFRLCVLCSSDRSTKRSRRGWNSRLGTGSGPAV
jgi:hypothetical protein